MSNVVYIVYALSRLYISAFLYDYGGVFKLEMVDIRVGHMSSSNVDLDEYFISEVLMIKHSFN